MVLSERKKQGKFKKFLDELKKKSHDIEHRGLEDYLIRPVQRIPVCTSFKHFALFILYYRDDDNCIPNISKSKK